MYSSYNLNFNFRRSCNNNYRYINNNINYHNNAATITNNFNNYNNYNACNTNNLYNSYDNYYTRSLSERHYSTSSGNSSFFSGSTWDSGRRNRFYRRKKRVTFNGYATVINVESYKKYNVDVSTKRSLSFDSRIGKRINHRHEECGCCIY